MKNLVLKELWDSTEEQLMASVLHIVCNTQSASPIASCQGGFNMDTEYFSDDEFEQIAAMFGTLNVPTRFFTFEDDFFRYILNEKSSDNKNILVYNAAQSGSGPGRKSLIPAFCNLHDLKCTGSNAYVVSLCRNKYHVNRLLAQVGVPVPNSWLYTDGWLMDRPPANHTKLLLKPIYESASIGIDSQSIQVYGRETDELIQQRSMRLQQPILAQEFIPGYEIEVPFLRSGGGIFIMPPVGISLNGARMLGQEILDYERVYFDQYEFYDFREEPLCSQQINESVTNAVSLLGIQGLGRIDFRVASDGNFYVTDVSTNPHFIEHSSVHFAMCNLGLDPSKIAQSILSAALVGE